MHLDSVTIDSRGIFPLVWHQLSKMALSVVSGQPIQNLA